MTCPLFVDKGNSVLCGWWYVHPPFDAGGGGVVVRPGWRRGGGGGGCTSPPLGKRRGGGVVVTPRKLKQLTPGYGKQSRTLHTAESSEPLYKPYTVGPTYNLTSHPSDPSQNDLTESSLAIDRWSLLSSQSACRTTGMEWPSSAWLRNRL